jgi:hypothetical protein
MQRDKRGRFIKKATLGTELTLSDGYVVNYNGKKYILNIGAADAFKTYQTSQTNSTTPITVDSWLSSDGVLS